MRNLFIVICLFGIAAGINSMVFWDFIPGFMFASVFSLLLIALLLKEPKISKSLDDN